MDENFSTVSSDPAVPPPPSADVAFPAAAAFTKPPQPVDSPTPAQTTSAPVAPLVPPLAPKSSSPLPKVLLFAFLGLLVVGIAAYAFSKLGKIGSQKTQEITLKYWGLWESADTMRPLLAAFEANHPGVKIDYVMQSPQEYRERLQSALSSQNRGPDIFRIHNTWLPMFKNDVSIIPPDIYSAAEFESTFYPVVRKDLLLGTGYAGIPLETDGLAMYINDNLLQKANLPVPQTWDDLKTSAMALTQCDTPDTLCKGTSRIVISGAALGNTTNVDHWQDIVSLLLLQNNVNPNNISASVKPVDDVINYYKGFTGSFHTWDTSFTSSTNEFAQGRVAIYFGPSWRVMDIKKINPGLKFSVYPVPQVPVDPAHNEKIKTWASYWVDTVNKRSANSAMAWELLKYLSSKDSQTKFYQAPISAERPFGEPYSRTDMASTLQDSVYVNAYISQAPFAMSWYLVSSTNDGATGINSRISAIFASVISGKTKTNSLGTQVNQVLSGYGITGTSP